MENLSTITSQLKELLHNVVDYQEKEGIIFKHIETAEKLKCTVDDFPSDLDWFNTLEPLSGSQLQGKIIVLDFFTYCCINCLHIIPHLRQLEENFSVADGLVVIGVHSAKFDNEKDSENILKALKRHNISHPVVNDKECHLWNRLGISCWPTLVILGPQKQPLFVLVGEGHRDELMLFVKVALKFYKKSISSHQLPLNNCDQIVSSSLLSFPGKITRWGNLFAISDSGNHRIVVFDENGYIKFKIGGKVHGFIDGLFETARFNCPQGLAFCDSKTIYVADTENHAIRLINLETLKVSTVVGNGNQGTDFTGGQIGTAQEISSPWDICVVPSSDVETTTSCTFVSVSLPPLGDELTSASPRASQKPLSFNSLAPVPPPPPPCMSPIPPPPPFQRGVPPPPPPPSIILKNDSADKSSSKVVLFAAAGTHQIWAYFLETSVWWRGKKCEKNSCVAVAGSGKEENRNNRYPSMASFAQPSGLTYSKELKSVFVADSESSSVRRLSMKDGSVSHVAGGARSPHDLFSYGDVDGKAYDAKLQHPLGVAWNSRQNCLFVCDTYNHKIKKIDTSSGQCESLPTSPGLFSEPGGCCFNDAEDVLYVCDTNNNCVRALNISDGNVEKFVLKERPQALTDVLPKDIWEAEAPLDKEGGTLNLTVEFSPEEVHGKWKLELDETKVKVFGGLNGKLATNMVEFNFELCPSDVNDVLRISFDLVLCGSETCAFKKLTLKMCVRRKEGAGRAAVCNVRKNLT